MDTDTDNFERLFLVDAREAKTRQQRVFEPLITCQGLSFEGISKGKATFKTASNPKGLAIDVDLLPLVIHSFQENRRYLENVQKGGVDMLAVPESVYVDPMSGGTAEVSVKEALIIYNSLMWTLAQATQAARSAGMATRPKLRLVVKPPNP